MGCYADVLTYFDGKCSGRSGCKVVIGSLDAVAQPCPKDFKSYLEASYVCIKGNYSWERHYKWVLVCSSRMNRIKVQPWPLHKRF